MRDIWDRCNGIFDLIGSLILMCIFGSIVPLVFAIGIGAYTGYIPGEYIIGGVLCLLLISLIYG